MSYYTSLHAEDFIKDNYLMFEQKAKFFSHAYDYSELDKLLIKPKIIKCLYCGKPSMGIDKEKNIYICFNCKKSGKLTDLDIVKKTKKEEKLKYYDEIYNELKQEYKLKTKEYALYAITFYKLDSTYIDSNLYEDEDVMFELIKNHSFKTCGDTYLGLKIFDNKDFQKRILELDKDNIKYIESNNPYYFNNDEYSHDEIFEGESDDDLPF